MEWISIKDRLPDNYECDYLVLYLKPSQEIARLNFKSYEIDIAQWDRSDMNLVNYHQNKGDHSWDWSAIDHWCGCSIDNALITHWLKIPDHPKDK